MARRKNLHVLDEETQGSVDKALKRTECMMNSTKRTKVKRAFKEKHGRNLSYREFDSGVVAGLFYAYQSKQITFESLCKRLMVNNNWTREAQDQFLMTHPAWAGLAVDNTKEDRVLLEAKGARLIIPTGMYADEKSLKERTKQLISGGLFSGDPKTEILYLNLFLKALDVGVFSEDAFDAPEVKEKLSAQRGQLKLPVVQGELLQ